MLRKILPFLALFTASCASLNIPVSSSFPGTVDRPVEAQVFFDINGTFYPDQWRARMAEARVAKAGSLLNAALDDERQWLEQQEREQLARLSTMIAGKKRVFIVVHGYNIDEAESGLAFDILERRIAFRPTDAVIRVHWDGLLGTGVGMGAIWFKAAAYSQVVGIRGLRRILELPRDQDVYLISHSRGASVVLSALGDPPFAPDFRRKTEALAFAGPAFLRAPPLGNRGNRIHAVLMAPAVGFPDFWDAACEPQADGKKTCSAPPTAPPPGDRRCAQYRAFTPQLASLRYTTNSGDLVLKKYAFNLRRYFNATDLGYDPEVGRSLRPCYDFAIEGYPIAKPHAHGFALYAQDPELAAMLAADGVEAR